MVYLIPVIWCTSSLPYALVSFLSPPFDGEQSKGVELSHPGSVQAARQSLGADEYLCLQAVHALATAISNGSKGGDAQLGEAAGGQGIRGHNFISCLFRLMTRNSAVSDVLGSRGPEVRTFEFVFPAL